MTINFHTPTERRSALAITFSLALQAVSMGVAGQQPDERIVVPLDQAMPDTLVRHATEVELIPSGPQQGLQVRFGVTDWPNVSFRPKQGVWDWTGYAGLAVDVFNPEPIAQLASMRVDNKGADGANHCNQLGTSIPSGKWTTFRLRFNK